MNIKELQAMVGQNFKNDHGIVPVVLVELNGALGIVEVGSLMDNKEGLASLIRTARQASPFVYFISEAWLSTGQLGQKIVLPPSEDPNRIETVIITAYEGVNISFYLAPINRPANLEPFLSPWENMESGTTFGGRLMEMASEN